MTLMEETAEETERIMIETPSIDVVEAMYNHRVRIVNETLRRTFGKGVRGTRFAIQTRGLLGRDYALGETERPELRDITRRAWLGNELIGILGVPGMRADGSTIIVREDYWVGGRSYAEMMRVLTGEETRVIEVTPRILEEYRKGKYFKEFKPFMKTE